MLIFYALALLIGGFLAVQSGINSSLSRGIDSSLWGAIISFTVGTVTLLGYALLTQQALPLKKVATLPPYLFVGGILGALYVLSVIVLFSKIGPVNIVILTVLGQMLFSLLIDHYGWFGANISPINWQKIGALSLMLVAIFWFQKARV